MSIIVYKQRHFNKQDVNTPRTAYGYIRYIATRSGTINNDGMNHGLFGRLNAGDSITSFNDYRNLARRAYFDTSRGHTYFKSVISLADEDAFDAGIFEESIDNITSDRKIDKSDRSGWERYIEKHVSTIASKNNIRIENLSWTCAIHIKDGHSHAHLVFWDKSEESRQHTVAVNKIAGKRINDLRKQLIKDTFPHKIRDYMKQRKIAYHSMRDMTGDIIDDFNKNRNRELYCDNDEAYDTLNADLNNLREYFKSKYNDLPIFNNLDNNDKEILINSAKKLINFVPLVKQLVDHYIQTKLMEDSLFQKNSYSKTDDEDIVSDAQTKKIEKYEEKLMEKAVESIARRIYNSIKSDINNERYNDNLVFPLLTAIVRLLKNMNEKNNLPNISGIGYLGELSKAAKKERYLKNQDKGFEH